MKQVKSEASKLKKFENEIVKTLEQIGFKRDLDHIPPPGAGHLGFGKERQFRSAAEIKETEEWRSFQKARKARAAAREARKPRKGKTRSRGQAA